MVRLLASAALVVAALVLLQALAGPRVPAEGAHRRDGVEDPTEPLRGAELLEVPSVRRSDAAVTVEPGARPSPGGAATPPAEASWAEPAPGLLVRAVDGDGAAIGGAEVEVVHLDGRVRRSISGEDGIARFDPEDSPDGQNAVVQGRHGELGLASDGLRIHGTTPDSPIELLLLPGARVEFLVLEAEGGAAVAGCNVFADPLVEDSSLSLIGETDGDGRATVAPVGLGRLHWYVGAPGSEHNVRGVLDVAHRGVHEVLVHLDEGGQPLAVEGRFVDAQGRPFDGWTIGAVAGRPTLMVGPDLSDLWPVHTDANGRFRYHREPCDELLVMTNLGGTGHVYAPERVTVPFGTRGLEFRLSRSFEERELHIECLDATSGEPVEGAHVEFYRRDPGLEREAAYAPTKRRGSGLRTKVLAIPDLRYIAWKQGYVHAHGRLDDLVREGGRIELTPGQRAEITVVDAGTETPIVGARILVEGGAEVAVTGEEGRAVLEGRAFDGQLEVTAEGYEPRRWYASWPGRLVALSPKR